MIKENVIQAKSLDFALKIIQFFKYCLEQNEYIRLKQLIRSETSIGVYVEEASAVQEFMFKVSTSQR